MMSECWVHCALSVLFTNMRYTNAIHYYYYYFPYFYRETPEGALTALRSIIVSQGVATADELLVVVMSLTTDILGGLRAIIVRCWKQFCLFVCG